MNVLQTFPLAARALLRNKVRSMLTMLGIVIGVSAVISMVTVGEGAKARVEGVFAAMGTNMLIVLSGSTRGGGMMGGFGSMPTLTWGDLAAIRRDASAVHLVAPQLQTRATLQSDDANWTTSVVGSTPELFEIRAWKISSSGSAVGSTASSSIFGDSDVDGATKVVVIGQTVADRLFGATVSPLGRTIRIRGAPFVVIGVLERKGQSVMGQDQDDIVFIPVSTFQRKIQGNLGQTVPGIFVISATSSAETARAQRQVEAILRERHQLRADEEDDFSVRNMTEIANAQKQGTNILTGLLAAIAVVSLIVGGIGIMNIMLVSVTERTREIGLRMAIGASPWNVLSQFLAEAVALSTAGGLIGIGLGIFAARTLATKLDWPFGMRFDMMIVAFGFSVLVGIVFGLYPAQKASRLDPIEALRYE